MLEIRNVTIFILFSALLFNHGTIAVCLLLGKWPEHIWNDPEDTDAAEKTHTKDRRGVC